MADAAIPPVPARYGAITALALPEGGNGIEEVGIAVQVDVLVDESLRLYVATWPDMLRMNAAEAATLSACLRALDVLADYNAGVMAGNIPALPADVLRVLRDSTVRPPGIDLPPDVQANTRDILAYAEARVGHLARSDAISVMLNPCPFTHADAVKFWHTAVAFVVGAGWFVPTGPLVKVLSFSETVMRYNELSASRTLVTQPEYTTTQTAATVISASKVNWFQINHHVGQDSSNIVGYCGKTVAALHMDRTSQEVRKAVWAAGKWTSTTGVLAALGIAGMVVVPADAPAARIAVGSSDDMRLRIRSRPAGTAHLFTYAAIVEACRRTYFSVVIPYPQNWEALKASIALVEAEPCAYHMGAQFLTGNPRKIAEEFSETDREMFSAFIHACSPNSTLARAPVIMRKEEVTGNLYYATIAQIRLQMQRGISQAAALELIARMQGGAHMGGMALADGKITQEAINEAIEKVKAEEDTRVAIQAGAAAAAGPPAIA